MFYFYPKIYYKINSFDYLRVTDISVYSRIKQLVDKYGHTSLRPYKIMDGESPDLISNKFYGNPKYDYIILILNDIRNVYEEWPKSHKVLMDDIIRKYGSLAYAKENYVKYYKSNGLEISKSAWEEQSVTDIGAYRKSYYDYEMDVNDNKTNIKLLNQFLIVRFEVELQQILSETQTLET